MPATKEELKARYPALAFLVDEPEIGQILVDADARGLSPGAVQLAIENSTWWKTHSATIRDYHTLAQTDPASFWQAVQQKADHITDMAAKMGLDMTPEQIYEAAKAAIYYGWDDASLQRSIVYQGGGTFSNRSTAQSRVKQLAADYFIPLAPEQVSDWTSKISSGQYTEQNFTAQLQSWAKEMYPHLSQQIDSGLTLKDYSQPYVNQIASLLEVNPNNINMATDPRFRQVIDFVDSSGNHRAMSLTESERYLKSQPEWKQTQNGRATTASTVDLLLRKLGQVA
jgi:hypothetical protein